MQDGASVSRSNALTDIKFQIARDQRRTASRGSRAKARTARVWSINHVVLGDRWTLGSMETPHNWENSAGLLVDRAHGHLSCRDRAPIDGSARFELTPVKSRVAHLGKSTSSDLPRPRIIVVIDTARDFPIGIASFI